MQHSVMLGLIATAASLFLATTAGAQQSAPPARSTHDHAAAPSVQITRTTASIRIDGVLDEAAWQEAPPITQFTQMQPDEGQPPRERMEVRLLLGDNALYVGARMFESDTSQIRARLARRDESVDGDVFGIYLDSRHDHLSAYYFRVTAGGAKRDATVSERGQLDLTWDAVWESAVSRDAEGWSLELRIPLSQIPYAGDGDGIWGVQIDRYRWNDQERVVFAYSPQTEAQGPPRYGHLTGMTNLPSPQRLELLPYVTARSEHLIVSDGNPFRSGSDRFVNAGIDLRYRITPQLNLSATVNPDFGQVEVDPAVVNLTAFETFFQERRPFFVEGRQLFNFGTSRAFNFYNTPTLFFSRRIGRTPQRQLFGMEHVDTPEATTIAGAAKVTGRLGRNWSVATLNAVTTREQARFVGAGDVIESTEVEPFTNYFVGRMRRETGRGNTQVGGYVSSVHRDLGDDFLADMLRSRSLVGGVDLNHSWDDRRWGLDGHFAMARVDGSAKAIAATQQSSARYYQRPDADHLSYDPTRGSLDGHTGRLTLTRSGGRHWVGSMAYQETSPGFEVNDIGFQTQADRRAVSPLLGYRETRPGRIFRNYFSAYFNTFAWNYGGDAIFAGHGAILEAQLLNYWFVFARADYDAATMDDRITRGGPLARKPAQYAGTIFVNSDPRNRWQAGGELSHRRGAQGLSQFNAYMSLAYQPSPTVRVALEPTFFHGRSPAQFILSDADAMATETFGRRYVFSDLEQRQFALVTRADWTFSPTLSLQLYLQPLVAAGEFRDFKQLAAPGTFDFEVYGQQVGSIEREDGVYTIRPNGDAMEPAITFSDPDFNFRSLRGNAVLRWEYRPGSTLFFVWQQRRVGTEPFGDFALGRDYGGIFSLRPENVFAVKATYWLTR